MDHLLHIHHQGLDTNPWPAINLLCDIFCSPGLCKCHPAKEIRPTVSENEFERDCVDLRKSTCVCFSQEKPTQFFPGLLIGLLVASTASTIWQNYVPVCVCLCNSGVISHRMSLPPSQTSFLAAACVLVGHIESQEPFRAQLGPDVQSNEQ